MKYPLTQKQIVRALFEARAFCDRHDVAIADVRAASRSPKEEALQQRALALISQHITRHQVVKPAPQSWDGKTLWSTSSPAADLHELAHVIVAPPERRSLPDFGLGMGFQSRYDTERMVGYIARQNEEQIACFVEWGLLRSLKAPLWRIGLVMEEESFSYLTHTSLPQWADLYWDAVEAFESFHKEGFRK